MPSSLPPPYTPLPDPPQSNQLPIYYNQQQQPYPTQPSYLTPPLATANNPSNIINVSSTFTNYPVVYINQIPSGHPCPVCGRITIPVTFYYLGTASWIGGALLCCVFWPLFWLPCVLNSCMDEIDKCPQCGSRLQERKKPWVCYAVLLVVFPKYTIIDLISQLQPSQQ
ncbi:15364_t:CDS:2 [Funneliformis mosseae]|uniref:15364_t:CDS:1 n=1 Tax=Funneliformis mosseae TaxID=27381 RepID=A0A9N9CVH1_FUNMO|nr:15364_t:CDS:2 [Funneliformis mosseae]